MKSFAVIFLMLACGAPLDAQVTAQATRAKTSASSSVTSQSASVQFTDITNAAGIKWTIAKLASDTSYFIETMGGGGGFLDYDNDGFLDIYFVNYTRVRQPGSTAAPRDALYRNNRDGTFTDVTDKAGINNAGKMGMGFAAADYDADGWTDFYVTAYNSSRLYRNQGNGTFTDVTAKAKVGNQRWGTSAAFFDYDADGWLDLYVCNYLDYKVTDTANCTYVGKRAFCEPEVMTGSASVLYRNNRDGTFSDVKAKTRVGNPIGKGLGVIAADFNNDGRLDIFQANDGAPNFLFTNNGDGTFTDTALEAGVAYDAGGNPTGAMGVDSEDINRDGFLDIFVTNFTHQQNYYFENNGDGTFTDRAASNGLGRISYLMSGFGTRFLDYNNDGLVDLFVLNGHPLDTIGERYNNVTYEEPPFLFENTGAGFREVAAQHGAALSKTYPGRGLATGDIDNDGDTDLLLLSVGAPPALLRNDGGNRNSWLGIKLTGAHPNRDATGARVTLSYGNTDHSKTLPGGTSYCTASDARLLFGLGKQRVIEKLEVRWLSGKKTVLKSIAANRYLTVKE